MELKDKRRATRRNRLARELEDKKYRQRVVRPDKVYKRERLAIHDIKEIDDDV